MRIQEQLGLYRNRRLQRHLPASSKQKLGKPQVLGVRSSRSDTLSRLEPRGVRPRKGSELDRAQRRVDGAPRLLPKD